MATYAIGDVQGCFDSLMALLDQIGPGAADHLWLAGDLVNRGPKSIDVLRWARAHPGQVVSVLGNHDLHLLAMAAGLREPHKRDTAQEVLAAPDADELVDWLRHRPFAHRRGGDVLVHAGIYPTWTAGEAMAYAAELEACVRSDWPRGLARLYGWGASSSWSEDLRGDERVGALAAVFTRQRCVRRTPPPWILDHSFDGPPDQAPANLVPWFDVDRPRPERIIFGHWAALGLMQRDHHLALDTGCVWGKALTAVRLDDGTVFTQPAIDHR